MSSAQAKAIVIATIVAILLSASQLVNYQIAKLNDEVLQTKQSMRELEIKVNQVKTAKKAQK